ncbi:hypothetical protein HHK36_001465 [Tetracentron sinense]|uniref:Pentatricopeptide repeat-containing protein n=1 Tax=Tetracentron sinense TaxID=13715 RepID=A0A835DS20_TETSI|nr:hypothetical protein HHK36_001465 [Tetracentron sinense]
MRERETASWNAMINGFAVNGCAKEALEVFLEMQNTRVKPNEVTMIGVLSACNHSGLVEEGRKWFKAMEGYGLIHRIEHYVYEGFVPTSMVQATFGPFTSQANVEVRKRKKSRHEYVGENTSTLNDNLKLVIEAICETSSYVDIPELVTEHEMKIKCSML